jgi:hypothetical protein
MYRLYVFEIKSKCYALKYRAIKYKRKSTNHSSYKPQTRRKRKHINIKRTKTKTKITMNREKITKLGSNR